jgi:hypothetical protein
MGACCREMKLSRLIPKNHFCFMEFFLNLYIHNLRTAATLSAIKKNSTGHLINVKKDRKKHTSISPPKLHMAREMLMQGEGSDWMTAEAIYEQKKMRGKK